ncbi:hypothetical protein Patl1_31832 [Pistacia atlantica]|uniref:Uncharacterized protein n=1 Tax=Pistacia atlantica TaxID=434234 RepID=A0ACC1AQ67_9ROSI|nr:hypothetical protein Patl1_31832 [Pistacia atlantica]
MINYALSHARSQKSDESYAQGLLVLEQCFSTQPREGQCAQNWRGTALLAMSTLLYERGNLMEAIDKAAEIAAVEALVGLHLQLGQDDTSSVVADKCLEVLGKCKPESDGGDYAAVRSRAKAVKGLIELVRGNVESGTAEALLNLSSEDFGRMWVILVSAALSYGEYLHVTRNFPLAKEFYQNVIEVLSEKKDFSDTNALGSCNMALEEVSLAATFEYCLLMPTVPNLNSGNFGDAEEILTRALTKTEELFGSHHPKVGVVLTCLALMFRNKAIQERSSSLLVQEGLYRRAIELLKAPPLDSEGSETKVDGRDIMALARGGYAEALCVQQNRKDEGERTKRWAEATWRNHRMSLAEALNSEPSNKVMVIDARTSRAM